MEAFHGWQTAGLNASKKLLMSPGRPRKAIDMALVPWRAGTGVPKGFGRFLECFTAGKRQAPVKSQEKLLIWPWCLGVRGQRCQKRLWRVLEGFTAGKRQAERQ